MQFKPSNRDDIIKYFSGSYLKFKETGDALYYLQHVDKTCITGQTEDGRDFKLWMAEEEPYEVDYILPHKSFFQYGIHATMLQRIPAKQYHRGITHENTSLSYKHDGVIGNLGLGFDVLKAFVKKQKFFTLAEAIKDTEKHSMVLTPRMMYQRQTRQIHIDFVPVARVTANTNKITMLVPIFEEEIKDFLKSTQEENLFTFGVAK